VVKKLNMQVSWITHSQWKRPGRSRSEAFVCKYADNSRTSQEIRNWFALWNVFYI